MVTVQNIIDNLQRKVILHSYLYYELDDSVVSDTDYDFIARTLAKYKNDYPELWKNSMYYKQFGEGYNGSTGFDLYSKLSDEQKRVIQYIAKFRHEKGE